MDKKEMKTKRSIRIEKLKSMPLNIALSAMVFEYLTELREDEELLKAEEMLREK